jgi:hypothetical protein
MDIQIFKELHVTYSSESINGGRSSQGKSACRYKRSAYGRRNKNGQGLEEMSMDNGQLFF